MKKQKILQVHNYYQIPGGEDTVVANEKRLLEENGHQVIQYTRHNSELKNQTALQKLLLPLSTIFNLRTYREVKQKIREEQIDVVHVHNTLNLISPSVYYAALSCKVPVVQTLHNFRMLCPCGTFYRDGHICEDCVEKGLGCAVRYKCYRGSRVQTLGIVSSTLFHRWTGIYRKIHFICLTEFNREKLLMLNRGRRKPLIDAKKTYIKPNFTFSSSSVAQKTAGSYYLFVGRMEEIKGIDLLLEAFSRLPEVELHVAGSGKEEYEQYLQERDIHNIKLLGFLNREQMKREYVGAKALVVTSQCYEGFPMVITEAFSNGVPVIAGNMGNSGDLVEEEVTGIHFQYNDANDLIRAVRRFEQMDTSSLRENAYQKYTDYLSHSANYQILWDVYTSVQENP